MMTPQSRDDIQREARRLAETLPADVTQDLAAAVLAAAIAGQLTLTPDYRSRCLSALHRMAPSLTHFLRRGLVQADVVYQKGSTR